MAASELIVRLDLPLPASLPAGRGTAVLCLGACFHEHEPLAGLELLVDGVAHRPAAWRMPRLDLFQALPDEMANSYRGGFWGTVPIPPRDREGAVTIEAAARLASGERVVAELGSIPVRAPAPVSWPADSAGTGLIAVCMATFEPDPELLRAQVESLKAQTDANWVCVVGDDGSSPEGLAAVEAAVSGDPRFLLSRGDERLGFYRNFERILGLVPAEAELVALCDQDDRWHEDKLAVLRAALGDAQLVYSDQRLVDRDGRVLAESLWTGRRNDHESLVSLLVANSITGAASLFRREVADLALPFPEAPGLLLHDHWLGLVALASGDVAYVDRPLYDYVQHGEAVLAHGSGPDRGGGRSGRSRGWRAAYFYGYLPRLVLAETLRMRCAGRLSVRKRRGLGRFIAADRSPAALAWLAARPLRRLAGRGETLGSEGELALGIVWRHLVRARAGRRERPEGSPYDASCPPLDASALGQERLGRWRAGA